MKIDVDQLLITFGRCHWQECQGHRAPFLVDALVYYFAQAVLSQRLSEVPLKRIRSVCTSCSDKASATLEIHFFFFAKHLFKHSARTTASTKKEKKK